MADAKTLPERMREAANVLYEADCRATYRGSWTADTLRLQAAGWEAEDRAEAKRVAELAAFQRAVAEAVAQFSVVRGTSDGARYHVNSEGVARVLQQQFDIHQKGADRG